MKRLLLLLAILVIPCLTVKAASVSDLYSLYDIEYDVQYPSDILDTIVAFQNAEKYVSMYRYVIESEFDPSIIDSRISKLEVELANIEEQLFYGYNLSIDKIYELENDYKATVKQLEQAKKSLQYEEVSYEIPTAANTPSKDEYDSALAEKSKIDAAMNLGSLDIGYPVMSALINEQTDKHLELAVAYGSDISAIFNGTVYSITDESVTLYHTNDVYTYYGNLSSVNVEVGNTVGQGDVLGKSKTTLMLKIKLDGQLVDISKIFKED